MLNSQREKYKLIVLGDNYENINNQNIIFAGEQKPQDLPNWYRTGDVYLHLAWIEPCGNTQTEAMACGLPTICCNNGGIGETVNAANGGIVVDADNLYNFDFIDYYNPPEPNYINLIKAVKKVFSNLDYYKNKINFEYLDINIDAIEYIKFIKKIYEKD